MRGPWSRRTAATMSTALLTLLAACGTASPALSGPSALSADDGAPRAWGFAAGESDTEHAAPTPIGGGWGPSAAEVARARRLVGAMSLRERAGQVIVARYAGTAPPVRLVSRLHLGGVIVLEENITGLDQIRRSNRALQTAARRSGRRAPLLLGVDQEGGVVERVTGATRFPAFMTAGAARRPSLTRRASAASGAELAGLGFTVDFAPVADVTIGRSDPTIGARAASADPEVVADHVVEAAGGFSSSGVVPVLKHFPGHGSVTADSHLTLPVQRRPVSELAARDFPPFRAGVAAGVPSIMVGHVDLTRVDPGVPSSLSRPAVTGLLRERLGFDGLVVTDALNMRAVTDRYSSAQSAVRALRAGADVVLMPSSPRDARDGIVRAVRAGRLSSARLVQAATRQLALLLHRATQGDAARPPGAGRAVSRRWSAAALTSVAGPCAGRLVGGRVRVRGPEDDVATFRAAARAAGLRTGRRGTEIRLVGHSDAAPRRRRAADVVVALDTPYPLGRTRARVRLATYGATPGAMTALVRVLLGRAEALGRLPVDVRGVPRAGCS